MGSAAHAIVGSLYPEIAAVPAGANLFAFKVPK
jgi:hypothetical protein